jgi:uncharacterized iron-regulated membrane protein
MSSGAVGQLLPAGFTDTLIFRAMNHNLQTRIRGVHRYLGLLLGIQFLLWTAGGLYFSWSDMDEIHGDHQRLPAPPLRVGQALVSPGVVIDSLREMHPSLSLVSVQLIDLFGEPVYQVVYQAQAGGKDARKVQLATAALGKMRGPLTRQEAIRLARNRFRGTPEVEAAEYLTATDARHEYRQSPLPAYAVRFRHPSRTTIYVAAELGTVQKFRNEKWRVFDFLWMLHTMDYSSRDYFGNLLLRTFSIFGLFTIVSGFVLYYLSSRTIRRLRRSISTAA